MDTLVRDVRHAWRLLFANRGFAAAALITIALGVGGTTAVFSVINGVLLRPLPYPEPERLVRLREEHPGGLAAFGSTSLSHLTWHQWLRATETLDGMAAFRATSTPLAGGTDASGDGTAQRVRVAEVTPSLFRVLRVSPVIGRFFDDADAQKGAAPVAVITHAMWRERFGGDTAALGQVLRLSGVEHRIIGVASPGFTFPGREGTRPDDAREIALYLPYAVPPLDASSGNVSLMSVIARLKPGATIARAEAEGTARARSVTRPLAADLIFGKGGAVVVHAQSMQDQMTRRVRPALLVLAAAVGLVLLIACANVANLFLSRGADRARELAVRAALGASRPRLLRQLLTESLTIAITGGALGLFVGWLLIAAVPALAPPDFPRLDQVRLDLRVAMVAALSAIVVGALSGLIPSLRSSRVDLAAPMHASSARTIGTSGARIRRALLVVEAALAVVMLVGATLLARSFVALVHVDAGYDSSNVLTAELTPTSDDAAPSTRFAGPVTDFVERIRAIPSVRAAGAGSMAPFGNSLSSSGFVLPGMTGPDGTPLIARALQAVITPGYAEVLGLRLKEGRVFRQADTTSKIVALLVNEAFATTYFNDGRPATGRRFTGMFPRILGRTDAVVEVVGVVRNVLFSDLDGKPQPTIYVPYGTGFGLRGATLVVKTDGDPVALAATLRDLARQAGPGVAIGQPLSIDQIGPLDSKISASVAEPRFTAFVLGAFSTLALALAITGLYGVLSYHVAQRRREIGVRAALGATRGDLVRMVLREGLSVTLLGLAAGLIVSAFATRAMASLLFGVTPLDAVAFAAGPLLLLVVAGAACLIPARRAARIDPAVALRAE